MNKRTVVLFLAGILFGFGLGLGGMAKQEIVLSFLQLKDLGLLVLLEGAASVTFIAINIIPRFIKKPLLGGEFKPRTRTLSRNTIIGAIIFGIGWGISGQCPGSAIASLGIGNFPVVVGLITMFIGAYLRGIIENPKR